MRCCNDGLPVNCTREQIRSVRAPALRTTVLLQLLFASELTLMDIRTTAECTALSSDDGHVSVCVDVEFVKHTGKAHHHRVVEGVQFFRAVEGDCRDPVSALVSNEVGGASVWHG